VQFDFITVIIWFESGHYKSYCT